jgi:hypothetical protein
VCARGRHTSATSFDAMRVMSKGEVGTRTRIGYNFIVRETGGRTGQEYEGGHGRRKSHKCRVCPGDKTCRERRRVFRQLLPLSSWVSVPFVCGSVKQFRGGRIAPMRQFRMRTDLVQCDMVTVQYKLFNFGVNKFISGVNLYNLGVNIYSHGVNQVRRMV